MNELINRPDKLIDVDFLYDGYELYKTWDKEDNEIQLMARALTGLVNSHGEEISYLAILHQHDNVRQHVFKDLGYSIITMNGNRPHELKEFIRNKEHNLSLIHPRKLIAVTSNPQYENLFSMAQNRQIDVAVWVNGNSAPDEYRLFRPRLLHELLPVLENRNKLLIRLDAENHLIGLFRKGVIPAPKAYIAAIRDLVSDLGDVVNIQATADWERLRQMSNRDYQRGLEQIGVRTSYQIDVPGKNTSDIALASNIQESLERNPEINTFVLGTGDGDFLPLIDSLHERGKKAILISIKGTLNVALSSAADQVRFLDPQTLRTSKHDPVQLDKKQNNYGEPSLFPKDAFRTAMKFTTLLDNHKWHYCYYNRLPKGIVAQQIEDAVICGLIKHRMVGEVKALALNLDNPSTRQISFFVRWMKNFFYKNFDVLHKEYCSTELIKTSLQNDPDCKKMSIGQTLKNADCWLDLAISSGMAFKELRLVVEETSTIIETWWPQHRNFVR